jgi:hypothetical protein
MADPSSARILGAAGKADAPTRMRDEEQHVEQARNLSLDFSEQRLRFLIRDRDRKYSGAFDGAFRSEGARTVRTPVRA